MERHLIIPSIPQEVGIANVIAWGVEFIMNRVDHTIVTIADLTNPHI
ncbi:MAG: hypothetical protein SGI98_01160 [Verrucomicrobiota bacterium]|nr:hypothetical protein [Verrucomicrobiota bacterium]